MFETPSGEYIAERCRGTSLIPKGSVESRLQFELYGEYPLSKKNQLDYEQKIRPAFNLNFIETSKENLSLIKNHSL
jgi:hypothetical protein